jgi:recombination protein RecA
MLTATRQKAGKNGKSGFGQKGKSMSKRSPKPKYSRPDSGVDPLNPTDPARERALEQALSQIERSFGKGSIMRLDEQAFAAIPGISTGAISLDLALGGRGLPRGRVVEIYGPESSGKTTLALHVIANAQKGGGVAAFIDAEHALDPTWARKLGVDIDSLLVSQPDTGEQALEICEMLVRSNALDVVVIDSVAALIPRAEIEGEMGASHVGLQARLMSQALRKLTGAISRSKTCVIFINQIREKIGVMFGNPETTPGGRALKFYSSIRLDIRRTGSLKEGDVAVGNRVRAKVVKNKIAPPFRQAEFDIMFDSGISAEGDLLDMAVEELIADKSGAWFSYGDVRLGQGRENSKQFLKDNPDLYAEMHKKVMEKKGVVPVNQEADQETDQETDAADDSQQDSKSQPDSSTS